MPNQQLEKKLLNVSDMAELLGVTERTVWRYRAKKILPKAIEFSRRVRWDADAVTRWLASRTVKD